MKIKNKKLLTRLFALLASLVLVLALALPCFADETDQPPTDYIYKRVYSYDELVLLLGDDARTSCIIYESLETDEFWYIDLIKNPINEFYEIYWSISTIDGLFSYTIGIYDDVIEFTVGSQVNGEWNSDTYTLTWSSIQLYVLVPVSSNDDGTIIEEQGWYGQIKNIIKDAVFGSDTVLNDSQEFTLNQIALWLSLIVILLPFVIVAVIVVRCFR